ncbi:hypothetical protein BDA96_04G017100 [Sorghum bicolor]|uniref:Knottin scorpion toxin-like domain-containing protein n=2 Tax=Sorghum bicolor TaxID=4558 RepID=A0A921R160_SORBI|nr:hypothetical protein BDA96_04G017100 [Sorghum bicolor]KXG29309.1 hypothetical protein SORBI_3004G015100 [Sorghum bicolor]
MMRTNTTMKMQKILIFPLIVLLMLSSVLVASRYVSEVEGNKDNVRGFFSCRVDANCLFFNCLKSGACDRCCKSHGWVRGKCKALDCTCCVN